MYIKKIKQKKEEDEKKISLKMLCNWCSSEQLCKEWSNMYLSEDKWKNIKMTASIDPKEIDYLNDRLKNIQNIWLIGRYSYVLWLITKDRRHAAKAIDSYIKIIEKTKFVEIKNSYSQIISILIVLSELSLKLISRAQIFFPCSVILLMRPIKWYMAIRNSLFLSNGKRFA